MWYLREILFPLWPKNIKTIKIMMISVILSLIPERFQLLYANLWSPYYNNSSTLSMCPNEAHTHDQRYSSVLQAVQHWSRLSSVKVDWMCCQGGSSDWLMLTLIMYLLNTIHQRSTACAAFSRSSCTGQIIWYTLSSFSCTAAKLIRSTVYSGEIISPANLY